MAEEVEEEEEEGGGVELTLRLPVHVLLQPSLAPVGHALPLAEVRPPFPLHGFLGVVLPKGCAPEPALLGFPPRQQAGDARVA